MQKLTKSFIKSFSAFLFILGLVSSAYSAQSAPGGQASITLIGGATAQHQYNDTSWSLTKSSNSVIPVATVWPDTSHGTVVWNVTATKGSTTPNTLAFFGYIGIQNSGSAPATIGNIVVNLQRNSGKGGKTTNWVTVSSDVANSVQGNSATTSNVVSGASSEGLSVFTENSASGKLFFTDSNGNTTWSLVPAKTIAIGEVAALVFNAEFNNALLAIPSNEQVRLEVIVTFGNAGLRGGSGATASSVDINGDGLLSSDEANVRSVPCRYTLAVPALSQHNGTVAITDSGINVSGTAEVDFDTLVGFGTSTASQSLSFVPSVLVTAGGTNGGEVCNSASLAGEDTTINVLVGYNLDASPVYISFTYPGVQLETPSICIDVPADPQEPESNGGGDGGGGNDNAPSGFRTYSQGYYKNHTVSVSALTVGIGHSITFAPSTVVINHPAKGKTAAWTEIVSKTISQNINEYLATSDGGIGYLTDNLLNPTNTSAHNYGHQVVTMKLNLLLSASGVTPIGFDNLVYHQAGAAEDGKTVGQIVTDAEIALGSGNSAGGSPSDLMELLDSLVHSFDNATGGPSDWALAHLSY